MLSTLLPELGTHQHRAVPFTLNFAIKKNELELACEGELLLQEEAIQLGAFFDIVDPSFLAIKLREGWCASASLSEKNYAPIASWFLGNMTLNGSIGLDCRIDPSSCQLALYGQSIALHHPWFDLAAPEINKSRPARLTYSAKTQQWTGEVPLEQAELDYKEFQLPFKQFETTLLIDGNRIQAPSFFANCKGVGIRGDLDFRTVDATHAELKIETDHMAGSMEGFLSVLTHFPTLPQLQVPLYGVFESKEKGLVLSAVLAPDESKTVWQFNGSFKELHFKMDQTAQFTSGACELSFDSATKRLLVEKGEGKWMLQDGSVQSCQLQKFSLDTSKSGVIDFDLKTFEGDQEVVRLEGKALKNQNRQWEVTLNPKTTHLEGLNFQLKSCLLNEQLSLIAFNLQTTLVCQELHSQMLLLQRMGLFPANALPQVFQSWQLEGEVKTRFFSQDINRGISFELDGAAMKVKGASLPLFHLSGQYGNQRWVVDRLETDQLMFKGIIAQENEQLTFSSLEGTWQGLFFKSSGKLSYREKKFSLKLDAVKGDLAMLEGFQEKHAPKGSFAASGALKGDFSGIKEPFTVNGELLLTIDLQSPFALIATSSNRTLFSYTPSKGMSAEEVNFSLTSKRTGDYLGSFKVKQIVKPKGTNNFSFKGVVFSATPDLLLSSIDAKLLPSWMKSLEWDGNLEGEGNLLYSDAGLVFDAELEKGRYGYNGISLPMERVVVHYAPPLALLKAP
jgi:hypothetical protein